MNLPDLYAFIYGRGGIIVCISTVLSLEISSFRLTDGV